MVWRGIVDNSQKITERKKDAQKRKKRREAGDSEKW